MVERAGGSRPIRVGISTCLLGVNVRFDGGHKKDNYVMDVLGQFFEWLPVCPEIDVGMGVPRESVRLIGNKAAPRMIGPKSGKDWTAAMNRYSVQRVNALKKENLCGYILKSKSPSCGMERVRVYSEKGMPTKNGVGLYAKVLMERMRHLPIEEEGRLNDPRLRENFIVRVFCYHRWQELLAKRFKLADLMAFHARHKFLIMAHDEVRMRKMGKLVAGAKHMKPSEVRSQYADFFFEALKGLATTRKHTNVVQHIAGYFKRDISAEARQELKQTIEDYRKGLVPLIVPITLLRHHVLSTGDAYLADQVYLNPHPKEMMILNHV